MGDNEFSKKKKEKVMRQHPGPLSSKRKKQKRTEETTRVRGGIEMGCV